VWATTVFGVLYCMYDMFGSVTEQDWAFKVINGFGTGLSSITRLEFVEAPEFRGEFAFGQVQATTVEGPVISVRFNTRKGLLEAYTRGWNEVVYGANWEELVVRMREQ